MFEVTPSGREKVLYSFCSQAACADGNGPFPGLALDKKGNLYGTTYLGGANGYGTVFEVATSGKEKVLYSFCPQGYPCADGANPYAGLVFDKLGNLYGTTLQGGANNWGTVFEVTRRGTEKVLYSFCSQGFSCPDGQYPEAGLVVDKEGNLYGTTYEGGANYEGTVFEVTPNGTEKVLYSFCSQIGCADGRSPVAALVLDKRGNLYGTTTLGGGYGNGTLFKVTP